MNIGHGPLGPPKAGFKPLVPRTEGYSWGGEEKKVGAGGVSGNTENLDRSASADGPRQRVPVSLPNRWQRGRAGGSQRAPASLIVALFLTTRVLLSSNQIAWDCRLSSHRYGEAPPYGYAAPYDHRGRTEQQHLVQQWDYGAFICPHYASQYIV